MRAPSGTGHRAVARLVCFLGVGLAVSCVLAQSAAAQLEGMRFGELGGADQLKSERQRELVVALARRHLGVEIGEASRGDVRTLQRLLDEGVVGAGQTFELQSLGVVLGDVMAATLRLHWVVVDDEQGHSRALRFRESKNVFFPITMISRRVEGGLTVDVEALYRKTADAVAELERRPR